jgi:cytochrome c oxidase assembly protein subunit 15
MKYDWYVRMVGVSVLLALTVVVLGAYVRLTDAGLGCPDGPGCYGSLIVPDPRSESEAAAAAAEYPERPLDAAKAWNEMLHRYVATTVGFTITVLALLAWLNRRDPRQPVKLPIALLGVVIFQGLLGMWTVTLLLKPLIVMGHLLGGLTTLGLSFWLFLEHRRRVEPNVVGSRVVGSRAVVFPTMACLIILIVQIALGGWTSSNYAALACPDLPTCQGQWWPEQADFAEGFVLWRGLGIDYEFGILEAPARVAIHYVHRLGAFVTFLVLGFVAIGFLRNASMQTPDDLRRAGQWVLVALIAQVSIGIGVVWFGLPLWLATAHNGVAALLLLSVINMNHAASLRAAPA